MDGLCWFSVRSVHVKWALDGFGNSMLWIAMPMVNWIGKDPVAAMTGL